MLDVARRRWATGLATGFSLVIAAAASLGCRHHRDPPPYWPEQQPVNNAPAAPPTQPTRDLGAVAAGACDVAPLVTLAGGNCHRVPGVQATGSEAATSANAFDGSTCTVWNSGGSAPKFVAVDLGSLQTLTGVVLVPESTPPVATSKQIIERSDDGINWKVAYVIEGQMATMRAYAVPFASEVSARYLRVTTEKSDSWVAWRDIVPLDCR